MISFIAPTPLGRPLRQPRSKSCPPRRARRWATESLLSPPTSESVAQLKERSVITLRGLSDLGGVTLLHELARRLILSPNPNLALISDSQLLLGGLIGIWTAAVFAERLREKNVSLKQECEELPTRWDSNLIYNSSLEEDDIQHAIAWLYAFDEMEGIAAVDLLRSTALSDDSRMRYRLAEALGTFPIRSNITFTILSNLARDANRLVREAATTSLDAYEQAMIIKRSKPPNIAAGTLVAGAAGSTFPEGFDREEELAMRGLLERIVSDPEPVAIPALEVADFANSWHGYDARWLRDVMQRKVGSMRDAALSQPELPDLTRYAPLLMSSETTAPKRVGRVSNRTDVERLDDVYAKEFESEDAGKKENGMQMTHLKSAAPLVDSLRLSEIHGICALALVPALYELFAVVDGESLPLRFLGLGWLLALGGLVAYPQSANIWSAFAKTIDRMPRGGDK